MGDMIKKLICKFKGCYYPEEFSTLGEQWNPFDMRKIYKANCLRCNREQTKSFAGFYIAAQDNWQK